MSKIVTLTLTIPADDAALVEDVKAAAQQIVTAAGIQDAPDRPQPEGSATLPGIPARIFFLAAGVKLGRVAASAKQNGRKT